MQASCSDSTRWQAEWVGEYLQDDMFLDTQERHLLAGDRGLRLRSVRRLDEADGERHYVLTYKGARQESTVKQREEIELEVSAPQPMLDVFNRLGYRLMLHLQMCGGDTGWLAVSSNWTHCRCWDGLSRLKDRRKTSSIL